MFGKEVNRSGGRWRRRGAVVALAAGTIAAASLGGSRSEPSSEAVPEEPLYEARFTPAVMRDVVQPVAAEVSDSAFAGAAIAIGVKDLELQTIGIGDIGWTRNAAPVDPNATMYDLASLTKLLATSSAVMLLVDEGKMSLDEPLSHYFPEFASGPKSEVTIRHLLTHTSGMPAGGVLHGETRADRIAYAAALPLYPPAGAHVTYSDIGYVLLYEAAERAAGEPLPRYLERKLYRPLGMSSTRYAPGLDCEVCAPTGRLRDQSLYRGLAFDPIAQQLDDVSGNAGLFATAQDVGRFAAMIANGGELDGVRVISEATVREFTSPQPFGMRYRLGWEVFCDGSREVKENGCADPDAIGHTGWTGTSLYLEPDTGLWVVLLTNRTYEPRAANHIQDVRRALFARARERLASP